MGERQRVLRPEEMATISTAVATTVPPQLQEEPVERVAVITLRPTATRASKKVVWTEDTVDNENMNKKKSKCCCIYEKPRSFGESESESSDDECEHCFGHVERKHKHHHHQHTQESSGGSTVTGTTAEAPAPAERAAVLTLQPEGGAAPASIPAPPDRAPTK